MPSSHTIGKHFEAFIQGMIESGRYASASEVMRDALRLLEEQEQLRAIRHDALKAEIQKGLASGDAGPWDVDAFLKDAERRFAKRDADAA